MGCKQDIGRSGLMLKMRDQCLSNKTITSGVVFMSGNRCLVIECRRHCLNWQSSSEVLPLALCVILCKDLLVEKPLLLLDFVTLCLSLAGGTHWLQAKLLHFLLYVSARHCPWLWLFKRKQFAIDIKSGLGLSFPRVSGIIIVIIILRLFI